MIVLDTHAWVWWVDAPERLSERARAAIDASPEVAVSAISTWEVAMLVERERIRLDRSVEEWTRQALTVSEARLVDVDLEIALVAADLMDGHLDPADAMIAATGLAFDAPVITRDRRLADLDGLDVVW